MKICYRPWYFDLRLDWWPNRTVLKRAFRRNFSIRDIMILCGKLVLRNCVSQLLHKILNDRYASCLTLRSNPNKFYRSIRLKSSFLLIIWNLWYHASVRSCRQHSVNRHRLTCGNHNRITILDAKLWYFWKWCNCRNCPRVSRKFSRKFTSPDKISNMISLPR